MKKNYKIEIVSSNSTNKKIKIDLLEGLCEKILKVMKYEIYEKVREKGEVVEFIAKNTVSNEKIYIKCKAPSENVSPSDIRQLVGRLIFEDIKYGWLFTTEPLDKDAEVLKIKSEESPFEKTIYYYIPDKIIELLISAKKIINPLDIRIRGELVINDNITLIVSEYGYYWLFLISISAGVSKFALFSADDGKQIFDENLLQDIAYAKWGFKEIQWALESITSNLKTKIQLEEKSGFIYSILKKLKSIILILFINIKKLFHII